MSRSGLHYKAKVQDESALRLAMIRLAKQYGRYGYRKVIVLRIEGWHVNHKKVERLWREEGLKLPERHKKRRRLYHKDSSVIRLRPTHPNHVWAIDFVHDKLSSGRSCKMLTVLDEFTRQALWVEVQSKMNSGDVLQVMHPLLMEHRKPDYIRSDNGGELVAEHLQEWLRKVGVKPIQIYPGSPWENGYDERFNGILRQEVLNAEWFHSIKQAQVAINAWLKEYNHIRPHHALGMRPPVPETLLEKSQIVVLKLGARHRVQLQRPIGMVLLRPTQTSRSGVCPDSGARSGGRDPAQYIEANLTKLAVATVDPNVPGEIPVPNESGAFLMGDFPDLDAAYAW